MHPGALGPPLLATADAKKNPQAGSAGRHVGVESFQNIN